MNETKEETKEEISGAHTMRLQSYFSLIKYFGLISVFAIWIFASLLPPEYLSFFDSSRTVLWVMFGFFLFSTAIFFLRDVTRNSFLEFLIGASWSFFFFFVIWQSGGVTSAFLILLVYAIFVAATDLSDKLIIFYGSLNVFGYASLLLFQPEHWHSPAVITQYILQITFLSIICLYAYWLVKEILRQKYEKQEASKKFFQLAEVDRVKSDFIMVVSHQLRTPLTGARYALELLHDTKDEKSRAFLIAQIDERVSLSLSTINEMIKSIELGPGSMRNNWTNVSLGDLLKEVNEDLRYDREKGQTRVDLHVDDALSVFGDRNLLKTACTNVIENAIRYAPGKEVIITATTDGAQIRIIVRDTGIGISPNDQPHVFDRFFRAKNSMHLFPNESGIGLFIARLIIERHLGTIELVTSELGKGTTMQIKLPVSHKGRSGETTEERVAQGS